MEPLFEPYKLGALTLPNRIVMAPMTRARCADYVATADTAEYYRQRADAGLIITEGTPVSPEGQGFVHVPGIWSQAQTDGWRKVTEAVHGVGGRIFAQLWHVGRISHRSLQPGSGAPVSSTDKRLAGPASKKTFAIRDDGTVGFVEATPPRALGTEEVSRLASDFGKAAANADAAEFDGIELHAANGYIFEQFLNPHTNDRQDRYGGSIESRARLLLETVERVTESLGPGRAGVRLSPHSQVHDMTAYEETDETYLYLAEALRAYAPAYVHLNDQRSTGNRLSEDFVREFKSTFGGCVIMAGGMTRDFASDYIARGLVDLAAFGQPFIGNPDLVARLRHGRELTVPDRDTYYGGGAEGYLDYPTYARQSAS